MVNCNAAILDAITNSFMPQLDRHVGQRNVMVVEAAPSQLIDFPLMVNNLFPTPTTALITAHIGHFAAAPELIRKTGLAKIIHQVTAFGAATNTPEALRKQYREGIPEFQQAARAAKFLETQRQFEYNSVRNLLTSSAYQDGGVKIGASLPEEFSSLSPVESRKYFGALLVGMEKLTRPIDQVDIGREIPIREIHMKTSEQRQVTLHLGVPGNIKPGEFFVFHMLQRAAGILVGGYTVVATLPLEQNY
jgi:hypothetical protein